MPYRGGGKTKTEGRKKGGKCWSDTATSEEEARKDSSLEPPKGACPAGRHRGFRDLVSKP